MTELPKLTDIEIERCVKAVGFSHVLSCQLHNFSDASQDAYGAVSYLRMVNEEGRIRCAFLIGKFRVAPFKPMTIPRL